MGSLSLRGLVYHMPHFSNNSHIVESIEREGNKSSALGPRVRAMTGSKA